jgi:hypothetical protein
MRCNLFGQDGIGCLDKRRGKADEQRGQPFVKAVDIGKFSQLATPHTKSQIMAQQVVVQRGPEVVGPRQMTQNVRIAVKEARECMSAHDEPAV